MADGDDSGDMVTVVMAIIVIAAIVLIVFVISIVFMPLAEVLADIAEVLANSILIPLMTLAIASNPDIYLFRNLVGDIVKIMSLLYIVGIILSGLYIVLVSSSPVERARAKSIIMRLIAGLVMLTVSLQAYDVLLKTSSALAIKILSGAKLSGASYFMVGNATVAGVAVSSFMSVFIIIFVIPVLLVALATLGLRYIAAALFGILFPITITLYFIEVTRGIGANMMRYTLMVLLTQPATAIVFYITIMSLNSMGTIAASDPVPAMVTMLIGISGFLLVALMPLIMLDIMKWFGGAVAATGMMVAYDRPTAGGAMVALGGYAAGMGPEALVVGYSMRTLGSHALGEKADAQRTLAAARQEVTRAKNEGRRPDLSTDNLRNIASRAKHFPSKLSLRDKIMDTREEKLLEKGLGSGIGSTYDQEVASADSMLPAPVEAALAGVDAAKEAYNRVVRGSGLKRAEIVEFNNQVKGSADAHAVGAATHDMLVKGGMSDAEATQWAASIENSPDLNSAKEKGRAAVVYNRVTQDPRFRRLNDQDPNFFDDIKTDIQSGRPEAMRMDNVAAHVRKYGEEAEQIQQNLYGPGHGWTGDDTEKLVDGYIRDYKYYYNRYGEKGEIFSVVGTYKDSVVMNAAHLSPEDLANYEEMFKELGPLAFALDLGANMHGRMLLEDYMGTGPRPSEFYHGLGPDTREEYEREQKTKRKEGDEHTWETI